MILSSAAIPKACFFTSPDLRQHAVPSGSYHDKRQEGFSLQDRRQAWLRPRTLFWHNTCASGELWSVSRKVVPSGSSLMGKLRYPTTTSNHINSPNVPHVFLTSAWYKDWPCASGWLWAWNVWPVSQSTWQAPWNCGDFSGQLSCWQGFWPPKPKIWFDLQMENTIGYL